MNFKKKLFMMSLVASMVVPSNLALVASVTTPVFAEDNGTTWFLKSGNYTLNEDRTLTQEGSDVIKGPIDGNDSISILINQEVVINLGGHTITSEAINVFQVSGTLTLTGGGKVECTSKDPNAAAVRILGGDSDDDKATVRIEKGVTLEATNSLGIYQIYNSETYLTDCEVKGKTGIEIRAGNLEVSGGTITATSEDLTVIKNDYKYPPYPTLGAAIAIVPYNSLDLNVDIRSSILTGKAGVALINPQEELEEDGKPFSGNIDLQINQNTKFGAENIYDIGYNSSMKEFLDGIKPITSKFNQITYGERHTENNNIWAFLEKNSASIEDGINIFLAPDSLFYTGEKLEPEVTVEDEGKKLTLNKDYLLEYKNNINPGTASVIVKGIKEYTGTATATFEITKALITDNDVRLAHNSYPYTGEEFEPEVMVKVGEKELEKGTDYTVNYTNNIEAGEATVTVTGIGNYTGTASATFEIEEPTIKDSDVTLPGGPYVLDNGKCEPVVTVVVNGKTLVKGTDYEVTYANSSETGSATVSVVGKGNYKGTVVKNYTIKRKTFTSDDISLVTSGPYLISENNLKPEVKVAGISKDNYDLTYSLPTDEDGKVIAGEATVIVTGKGDYEGCIESKTYVIIDDRNDTIDISFKVPTNDDSIDNPPTTISLNIPTQYLPIDDNGKTKPISDKTLSEALTEQSNKQKIEGTNQTPSYKYEVIGLGNSNEYTPPAVKVKVNRDSIIRLILQKVSEFTKTESGFVEMSEVSMLSDEEMLEASANNEVIIYASLAQLDTNEDWKVTKDEVETYIKDKPQYSKANVQDFEEQNFEKFLELGKEIILSDDGFFEISAEVKTATTKPVDGSSSDSSSHKPTTPKPTPITPEEPAKPVGTPTSMYRLYNRLTGEHLYTTDKAERDHLLTSDTWKDEGQGWVAPSVSDYPVYRLLNPNTGDHHYTTDKNEFDTLPSYGWVAEGIAFYSADKDDADKVILHRLYNPNAKEAGMHHYTTDENERDVLVSQGWAYEGTAWAGLKSE